MTGIEKTTVFQLNLNKSTNPLFNAISLADTGPTIFSFQEIPVNADGKSPYLAIKKHHWHHGALWNNKMYAAILTNIHDSLFLSQHSNEFFTTVLFYHTANPFIVISGYLNAERDIQTEVSFLTNIINSLVGFPIYVCIDSNSHHTSWGSLKDKPRGTQLFKALQDLGIWTINDPACHTWTRNNVISHIDLTIVNDLSNSQISEWKVDEKFSDSDHLLIQFTVASSRPGVKEKRKLHKTNWDTFENEILSNISVLNDGPLMTQLDIDTALDLYYKIINNAYESASYATIVGHSTPFEINWWSRELEETKKKINRLRKICRTFPNQRNKNSLNYLTRKYKSQISKNRQEAWLKFCESGNNNVWGPLSHFISKGKSAQASNTTILSGDKFSATPEETADLLLKKFVTPLPNYPTFSDPKSKELPMDKPFTMIELNKALQKTNMNSAPGPDGLSGIVTKKAIHNSKPFYLRLVNACLNLGYFPKIWKKGELRLFQKPKKYSEKQIKEAENLRPITLLNISAKIFERMVANRLKWLINKHNWLHSAQFGFKPHTSTVDALNHLKEIILNGRWKKLETLVLSYDIKGAFDTAWHPFILKKLLNSNCPQGIFNILVSFLQERVTFLNVGSSRTFAEIFMGCPQGSVLSPTLWNLLFDSVFHLPKSHKIYIIAFADDLLIIIQSKSRELLVKEAKTFHDTLVAWSKKQKLSFNLNKTAACIFTTQRKKVDHILDLGSFKIPIQDHLNWLGMTLDKKLTFKKHVENVIAKVEKIQHRLVHTLYATRRPNKRFILEFYRQAIIPIITYAASVWQGATSGKDLMRRLDSVQRFWCCRALRAFPSTASLDLFMMTNILPIKEQILLASENHKINKLAHTTNNLVEKDVLISDHPFPPDLCEQLTALPYNRPDLQIYTDGSKTPMGVGTGVCIFSTEGKDKPIFESSKSYNENVSIFQAEALAIITSLKFIEALPEHKEIVIHCDNKALVTVINNLNLSHPLVLDIHNSLSELTKRHNISIAWIKAHHNITGNEFADYLAKKGANNKINCENQAPSKKFLKKKNKEAAHEQFENQYRMATHKRRLLKFFPDISVCRKRNINRATAYFLSGHGPFADKLHKMKILSSPLCRMCEESAETPDHLLFLCPFFETKRTNLHLECHHILNQQYISPSDFGKDIHTWELFSTFCNEIISHMNQG